MYKEQQHNKMIDIYEADLEDYFKYLLERVNNFLIEKENYQFKKAVQRKKAS